MELFSSLTVRENIEYAAETTQIANNPLTQLGLKGNGSSARRVARETASELIALTGLEPVANALCSEISTGHGRLVELARALARTPKILLLDEPSSGLDASESRAFGRVLGDVVADRGLGIFMIEHDMSLVLDVCAYIHVLDFGKPLMSGTPAEVRSSTLVREAYLGKIAVPV